MANRELRLFNPTSKANHLAIGVRCKHTSSVRGQTGYGPSGHTTSFDLVIVVVATVVVAVSEIE